MDERNEIVLFETGDRSVSLPVSVDRETVWLSANQMALLFGRDEKTIRKHINNVFEEAELEKENNTQKMRVVCRRRKDDRGLYARGADHHDRGVESGGKGDDDQRDYELHEVTFSFLCVKITL